MLCSTWGNGKLALFLQLHFVIVEEYNNFNSVLDSVYLSLYNRGVASLGWQKKTEKERKRGKRKEGNIEEKGKGSTWRRGRKKEQMLMENREHRMK